MLIIDLSNNNGRADFRRIKASGIDGAWLKVTEGQAFVDRTYVGFRAAARDAGMRVGGYHFARPDGDPVQQAEFFVRHLGPVGRRDLRPVLDFEVDKGRAPRDLEGWARAFVKTVRQGSGVCPMFYSYPYFISRMSLSRPIGCGLWLASYSRDDGAEHSYVVPAPWKRAQAHQFTSRANVPGVVGTCDVSSVARVLPVLAHGVAGLL